MQFPDHPTPQQIKQARLNAGLTQTQAGALIYKKVRTWQQWEKEGGKSTRKMDPALFELFLIKSKKTLHKTICDGIIQG